MFSLYKADWGCPEGGEMTYTLSAIRNPKFNDTSFEWKRCCRGIVRKLKKELNQSTVTSEFSEVDIEYYELDKGYRFL